MGDSGVARIMKRVKKRTGAGGGGGLSVSTEQRRQQALTDVETLMNKPSLI